MRCWGTSGTVSINRWWAQAPPAGHGSRWTPAKPLPSSRTNAVVFEGSRRLPRSEPALPLRRRHGRLQAGEGAGCVSAVGRRARPDARSVPAELRFPSTNWSGLAEASEGDRNSGQLVRVVCDWPQIPRPDRGHPVASPTCPSTPGRTSTASLLLHRPQGEGGWSSNRSRATISCFFEGRCELRRTRSTRRKSTSAYVALTRARAAIQLNESFDDWLRHRRLLPGDGLIQGRTAETGPCRRRSPCQPIIRYLRFRARRRPRCRRRTATGRWRWPPSREETPSSHSCCWSTCGDGILTTAPA